MSSTVWFLSCSTWSVTSKLSWHTSYKRTLKMNLQRHSSGRMQLNQNSALCCMISVDEALQELTEILRGRGRRLVFKAIEIDHELLEAFILFLVPFQKDALALEEFAEPTIHLVLYFCQNLLKRCQIIKTDSTIMEECGTISTLMNDPPPFAALEPKFAELVKQKLVWSEIRVIAALLNPRTYLCHKHFGIKATDVELVKNILNTLWNITWYIPSLATTTAIYSTRTKGEQSMRSKLCRWA